MNQIRRGYRLTPEEEAILRGELPAEAETNTDMEPTEKNTGWKRPGGALAAALVALLLMIGVAYLFFYLVDGGVPGGGMAVSRADSLYSAARKESAHLVFAPLSDAERGLLQEKLALTPEEEERFWPVFYEFAGRTEQAAVVHDAWLSALAAEAGDLRLSRHFYNQYVAVYKENISIAERYSERFSEILSSGRASWVFVLFAEIRRGRTNEKP